MNTRLKVRIFTLRYSPELGSIDDEPLRAFLEGKQLCELRDHFFTVHGVPLLSCVLTYTESHPTRRGVVSEPARNGSSRNRNPPLDPTAALTDEQRAGFESLRTWRSERAQQDGVPPYVIFSNHELVAIVTRAPHSTKELQNIDGIGPAKVKRYGEAVLARIRGDRSNPEVAE